MEGFQKHLRKSHSVQALNNWLDFENWTEVGKGILDGLLRLTKGLEKVKARAHSRKGN